MAHLTYSFDSKSQYLNHPQRGDGGVNAYPGCSLNRCMSYDMAVVYINLITPQHPYAC